MLKIENAEIMGWEHAIRGMRNPKNSWMKSDSGVCATHGPAHCADCVYTDCHADDVEISTKYEVKPWLLFLCKGENYACQRSDKSGHSGCS